MNHGREDLTMGSRCFIREVLLSAEYSPPRLLEIQCRVTSESVRQEGSLPHTCVMLEKAEGIQV